MNNIICETVSSIHNKDKLNIHGYLMVKDKNRKNLYYWRCEKYKTLKCRARATTLLNEDQHHLQNASEHNHAAEASRVNVVKTINILKERAQQTNDQPAQVIQTIVAQSSQETYPYLPSHSALRQSIKRIRHVDLPAEPQSLENLIIPESMKKTLNGSNFLIKDSTLGHNRILIFTTIANLKQLELSSFWVMDGTFKTVPTIFKQLYTIHGSVGGNENSRIMPLVYALMSSKSEECYKRLFQDLIEFSEEHDIDLQPRYILTDFEKAAINAIQAEFQNIQNKGCHFHLAQNVYRKVQHCGLVTRYGTDENFSLLIRHIPALAFLPPNEIPEAFNELKVNMPREANEIMEWFENYYVHGKVRRRLRRSGNVVRESPLFPPSLWSVVDNIEYTFPRTQNSVEAWHRRWEVLVGNTHVGVFKIIKEIQKEQNQVELNIESILRGMPRPLQKKKDRERENRIQTVYNDRHNRSNMDFLRSIAHNISL
jgi:MULE transposase domain/FLYWCH zinc finger domain